MTKVLAYCAFLDHAGLCRPETGVSGDRLQELTHGDLRLLWSEAEWPFDHSRLQRSALEFHRVVSHMFCQAAVVPFRLLSVFDNLQGLKDFLAAHEANFIADLERLQNLVQMECVLYFSPQAAAGISGTEYLQHKAEVLRGAEAYVSSITDALSGMSRGIRTRHSKNGSRIFVLVERGREGEFRSVVQALPLPERLARRLSGPWPAAEFLSDSVKMPQTAGKE